MLKSSCFQRLVCEIRVVKVVFLVENLARPDWKSERAGEVGREEEFPVIPLAASSSAA